MERMTFEDWRIDEVLTGVPLTTEERMFLIEDTPTFEECTSTQSELMAMSDVQLMATAYRAWSEYVSCM